MDSRVDLNDTEKRNIFPILSFSFYFNCRNKALMFPAIVGTPRLSRQEEVGYMSTNVDMLDSEQLCN